MRRLTDRAQAPPTHGGDKERALLSSHSIELKIQSELKSAMYNPEVPGKRFITYEKLCAVWANTSIDSIESFRSFFLEELQLVRRNYMRVLSILIYIGWDLARFRPVFLRCDLDDDKLCFDSDQLHELGELAPNFNDVQYIFKPVQIDSRPEIQSVSTKLRLPFTSMNEMSGTDGPGVVSRRVIAAGQFIESIGGKSTRTNKDPMVVACKQFEADFRWAPRARETRAYSIIRERSRAHEGILTHFATLAHGNDFIIVFPFAQHYSLEVFFKEGDEKRPTNLNQGGSPQVRERYHFTKKFPLLANSSILHLTMLSQACKLVDALLFLQKELQVPGWGDSYCVHENLEPPEILIDGNPSDPMTPAGTWKLTDFGLSMYEKGTDTRNIRHLLLEELSQGVFVLDEVFISNLSHNSGYLSPEQGSRRGIHEWPRSYHRERDDSLDWRKTDSWSVGCLLCELLAFSLSRRRGVDILRRARRDDFGIGFYETYGDSNQPMSQIYRANIRIKQSVLSWLHESAKAKPTYVSVVDQILRPYPEDRPNMRRIRSLLGALESGESNSIKDSQTDRYQIGPFMDNESESDDVESVFSIEDASSISSVATDELQDPAEEFISFLLSDKIVSHLISIASKETPDAQTRMFVRLRILLKVFGKDLHGEAKNVDEEAAGKLIRAKATYVTTRIKSLRDNLPNQQATLTSVSLVSSNESSQQDCASLRSLPADQGIIDHDDRLLSGRIEEEDVEDEDRNAGEEVAQQDSNVQYISLDVLKQADQDVTSHNDRLLPGQIEEEDVQDDDRYEEEEEDAQQDTTVQQVSLDILKQRVADSKAFEAFRLRFWRLLFPNPFRGVEHMMETVVLPTNEAVHTVTFNVSWDLFAFIDSEFDYIKRSSLDPIDLHKILTIMGTSVKAVTTTAGEYAKWKWCSSDIDMLEYMNALMKSLSDSTVRVNPWRTSSKSWSIECISSDLANALQQDRLSFRVVGSNRSLVEVAQQLSWLATVCRRPDYNEISFSSVRLNAETGTFGIQLCDLEPMKRREDACWIPLFTNAVVARGFPIARRYNQEKGLEIPFHIMTSLAKVMYPLEEPGIGHYLRAFSSLVFPSKVSANCETIQWHMTKPHKGYLKAGSMPPSVDGKPWAHTKTLEELVFAKRNFLGYVRAIEMHIGSGSAIDRKNIGTVFNSGANRENPAIALEWNRIQTGTSGLGLFGVQIEANIIYNQGLFYSIETSWYRGLLDTAMITPIIIYDHAEEAKCAWMVPSISAVLFMAHVWAKVVGDTLGSLPTAALSWNGGEAAYRAILDHSRDVIRDSLEEKEYTFRDLVSRLLICLDKIQHVEARARAEPRRSVSLETSEKLYGWDLVKIAQGNGTAWRQELEVSQNWRVLSRSCVVLFCQNAGELFRPASTTKICHVANPINTTSDCLVAPIKCLRFLSKEHGQRDDSTTLKLDDDLFWTPQGLGLFDDCNMCYKTSARSMKVQCKKTKQSISKEDRTRKSNLRPPEEGAVVFGRNKLQKTNYLVPESSSMSQTASTDTPATSLSIGDLHELAQPAFQTENRNRRWDFIHLFRKKGA